MLDENIEYIPIESTGCRYRRAIHSEELDTMEDGMTPVQWEDISAYSQFSGVGRSAVTDLCELFIHELKYELCRP